MRLGSRGTVVPRAGRWFAVLVCSGLAVVLSSTPSGGAPGPSEPAASALHTPAIRGSPDRPGASRNGGGPGTGPSCPDRGRVLDHGGPVETDPVVFLDFWGWHRDPLGEHRYLVDFLGAIGSSRWLGLVGHYCAGSDVRIGGVWNDPAPVGRPSDRLIRREGMEAVRHFALGPRSGADLEDAQVVVALPVGTALPPSHRDDCAYHERLDVAPGAGRNLAPVLTVLPYVGEAPFGVACGASAVNAGARGALDSVSITEGHELAEAITDPEGDGWHGTGPESEIADVCQTQPDYDIEAAGGTFAVQELWSDQVQACVVAGDPAGPPLAVVATGVSGHIDVRWRPPTTDGGTPVLSWEVSATPGASNCLEPSGVLTCSLGHMTDDRPYRVTVRALNALGAGAPSAAVTAVPDASPDCGVIGPYADLAGCDLAGADLIRADLSGADLSGADLARADLAEADLSAADLGRVDLPGADLSGADLSGATLDRSVLVGADLLNVDLDGADLAGSDLAGVSSLGIVGRPASVPIPWRVVNGYLVGPGADLAYADFSFARLAGADLRGADLVSADFDSADTRGADLRGADLAGADLRGTDLRGTTVRAPVTPH